MAYDTPEGTDDISIAIKVTIPNATDHLKACIDQEHGYSDSDSTACVHAGVISNYMTCGTLSRVMTANTGAVDEVLTFTPVRVLFDWIYADHDGVLCPGHGYYDGTDNKCVYFYKLGAVAFDVETNLACIVAVDGAADNLQGAVCSFAANKFTLTWTEGIGLAATGTLVIRYVAFG